MLDIAGEILDGMLATHCAEKTDPDGLGPRRPAHRDAGLLQHRPASELPDLDELGIDELREALWSRIEQQVRREGGPLLDPRSCAASSAPSCCTRSTLAWKDHLLALDHLKEGIGLRGYAQRDPLNEYKQESFELFQAMKDRIENDIVERLFRYEPVTEEQMVEQRRRQRAGRGAAHGSQLSANPSTGAGASSAPAPPPARRGRRPWSAATRSAATTPVPAARARSTRSATARR